MKEYYAGDIVDAESKKKSCGKKWVGIRIELNDAMLNLP